MDAAKYPPPSLLRKAHDVLQALFAAGALGMEQADIRKVARLSDSNTTRYLAQLANLGWVERVDESSRWRIGIAFARMAQRQLLAVARDEQTVSEFKQRITRI
ncbi:MAG TPA: helix-turn-helix domain-containing protein [Xanthomonadaceae bacterium]|nr:helix-turn-helix domain-containing protein [Xanthomonadaceae bacterium]